MTLHLTSSASHSGCRQVYNIVLTKRNSKMDSLPTWSTFQGDTHFQLTLVFFLYHWHCYSCQKQDQDKHNRTLGNLLILHIGIISYSQSNNHPTILEGPTLNLQEYPTMQNFVLILHCQASNPAGWVQIFCTS
jgi:hypothetical protein